MSSTGVGWTSGAGRAACRFSFSVRAQQAFKLTVPRRPFAREFVADLWLIDRQHGGPEVHEGIGALAASEVSGGRDVIARLGCLFEFHGFPCQAAKSDNSCRAKSEDACSGLIAGPPWALPLVWGPSCA